MRWKCQHKCFNINRLISGNVIYAIPILAVLLSSTTVFSQQKKDSLLHILKTAKDTTRVWALHDLASEYRYTSTDSALYYIKSALSLSEALGFNAGIHKSYWILGILYANYGDYSNSIDYCKKALATLPSPADSLKVAALLNNLGASYVEIGLIEEGVRTLLTSLQIRERNGASLKQLALAYQSIGGSLHYVGDLDGALDYATKAYSYYNQLEDKIGAGNVLANLAMIYQDQHNYVKARHTYFEAIRIQQESDNQKGLSNSYISLGSLYNELNQYDSALFFLDTAFVLARSIQNNHYAIMASLKKAETYKSLGDYASTIQSLKPLLREIDSFPSLHLKQQAHLLLAESYDALEKTEEALVNYKIHFALKDSLINKDNLQAINKMKQKHETEKQTLLLAQLQAENKAKQTETAIVYVIAIAGIVVIAGLVYLIRLRTRLHKQRVEKLQLEKSLQQYEIDMKQQELYGLSMNLLAKNDTFKQIKENINGNHSSYDHLNKVIKLIDMNSRMDEDWEQFKIHFEQVHHGFFKKLTDSFPDLTPNEQKLCAYFKLNFSTKEVAQLLNVSIGAINKSRQRMRKKLSICSKDNLVSFLQEF